MEELYKLAVFGGGGVGKTSFTIQLVQNHFVEEYDPTIEDTYRTLAHIDDETCLLEIIDTIGAADCSAMRDSYLRTVQGFLLIYGIVSRSSFEEVDGYRVALLRLKDEDQVPMVLCGNKLDLEEYRQVSTLEGTNKAASFGCPFFETSAKCRVNVEASFHELVRLIRPRRKPAPPPTTKSCVIL